MIYEKDFKTDCTRPPRKVFKNIHTFSINIFSILHLQLSLFINYMDVTVLPSVTTRPSKRSTSFIALNEQQCIHSSFNKTPSVIYSVFSKDHENSPHYHFNNKSDIDLKFYQLSSSKSYNLERDASVRLRAYSDSVSEGRYDLVSSNDKNCHSESVSNSRVSERDFYGDDKLVNSESDVITTTSSNTISLIKNSYLFSPNIPPKKTFQSRKPFFYATLWMCNPVLIESEDTSKDH